MEDKKLQLKPLYAAEKKQEKKLVDLWYAERGSFTSGFDQLMADAHLQRCAWFSGTMNGSDIHGIFQPALIKKFSDLLRRQIRCVVVTNPVYDEATETTSCSSVTLEVSVNMGATS